MAFTQFFYCPFLTNIFLAQSLGHLQVQQVHQEVITVIRLEPLVTHQNTLPRSLKSTKMQSHQAYHHRKLQELFQHLLILLVQEVLILKLQFTGLIPLIINGAPSLLTQKRYRQQNLGCNRTQITLIHH